VPNLGVGLKAICLFSGGLDGELAARLIHQQGIGVTIVHFDHIFIPYKTAGNIISRGRCLAEQLFPESGWEYFDISSEILKAVKHPNFGYGKRMNPCIDCRILMLESAKRYMDETGASFIVTGEVLGQRPMSQNRRALELADKTCGDGGFIVRPLSAKLLPVTIPEQKGWVNRDRLFGIKGRSRKEQITLAKRFKIEDYPNAAGGCLLTDAGFSRRLQESFQFGEDNLTDLRLLRVGRHFRLLDSIKLIIGRDERENEEILRLAEAEDTLIEPVNVPGPAGLLRKYTGNREDSLWQRVVGLCARYSDRGEYILLRYGNKKDDNMNWRGESKVTMPEIFTGDDNYCRRI